MKTILKILSLVYVKSFYAENASFFLVVIGLAGGFMSGAEHKALAEFFISTPATACIPVFLWMLYAIKVINFNKITTRRKKNEFLVYHSLYPSFIRHRTLGFVLFNQLVPAFLYGVFLCVTAAKFGAVIPLLVIVVGLLVILILCTRSLQHTLSHPNIEKKAGFINRVLNKVFIRPYPVFVIEWLSRKKTFLLISTMLGCSILLFGVLMLYTTDDYDVRLLQMALVISVSGNIQLLYEIQQFETLHFAIVGQQPLSFLKRVTYLIPVMLFISLPQAGLLLRYFPASLHGLLAIESVFFMAGYPFFLYGYLYTKHRTQEQVMQFAFIGALTLFVLTLFSVPLWFITVVPAAIGLYFWKSNFYTFEIVSTTESDQGK